MALLVKLLKKNNCSVVQYEVFEKSVNMLVRVYMAYLTSNREESESAYIQGVINMAKNILGENIVNRILKRTYENVYKEEGE